MVDSDQAERTTVALFIPYDAVELTDWAKESGWYIPKNGVDLTVAVEIRHPTIKVTKAAAAVETEVRIDFGAEHCDNTSGSVRMALVPSTANDFKSSATGSFMSNYGELLTGNGNYNINIPVSKLTAGTEYAVWVKIGDAVHAATAETGAIGGRMSRAGRRKKRVPV